MAKLAARPKTSLAAVAPATQSFVGRSDSIRALSAYRHLAKSAQQADQYTQLQSARLLAKATCKVRVSRQTRPRSCRETHCRFGGQSSSRALDRQCKGANKARVQSLHYWPLEGLAVLSWPLPFCVQRKNCRSQLVCLLASVYKHGSRCKLN